MTETTVYIGIGNSDDKLSQREWAGLQLDVKFALREYDAVIIGEWYSAPDSIYQNVCWCAVFEDDDVTEVKGILKTLAIQYRQDSIAWAEAPVTEMLGRAAS
jgi:hypothetical protein